MSTTIYLNITPDKNNNMLFENADVIKKANVVVRAIDSSIRQKIVQFIEAHGKATVTEIHTALGIDQPIASRHLAVLRQAKIVNTNRQGKFVYYTANVSGIEKIIGCMQQLTTEN